MLRIAICDDSREDRKKNKDNGKKDLDNGMNTKILKGEIADMVDIIPMAETIKTTIMETPM